MDMKPLNNEGIEKILKKYFRVLRVTEKEHKRLNASGLRYKMPQNWDKKDVWARYKNVGIETNG